MNIARCFFLVEFRDKYIIKYHDHIYVSVPIRVAWVNTVSQALVRLPPKISECQILLDFFTPTEDDLKATVRSRLAHVI